MSRSRRSHSSAGTTTRGLSISVGSVEKKVSDMQVSTSAPSARSFYSSYSGPINIKNSEVPEILPSDLQDGESSPSSSPSKEDKEKEEKEEGVLTSSSSKFKIFSPRRKSISQASQSQPPSPKTSGSPHSGAFLKDSHREHKESYSTTSSPRTPKGSASANSSPRTPTTPKRGPSPNSSPRLLKDTGDFIPLGDLPIGKSEAAFLESAAQARIADPKNVELKPYGMMYECMSKTREFSKRYEIVISGAGDGEGLGSAFYFLLDRSHLLGEGASARVYMAYNLQTGERFAAKVFKEEALFHMIEAEKKALLKMNRFYGGLHLSQWMVGEKIIFTTYLPGHDLFKMLYTVSSPGTKEAEYSKNALPISTRLKMVIGMMECVAEVHAKGLIHRDIKANNFRVNCDSNNGSVQMYLMDFDSAIPKEMKTSRIASTPGYLAPEILKEEPDYYTTASDLFPLGIVIWEVLEEERWVEKEVEKVKKLLRVNYQQSLKRKFEEIELKEKWRHQVTRNEIIEVMDRKSLPTACQTIEEYIYQTKIKAHIDVLIDFLMQEDPQARLMGSSLQDEIKKMQILQQLHEKLTHAFTLLIAGINTIQNMGIKLDNLISVTENIHFLKEEDLLTITTAALKQSAQPNLDPELCIEQGLKRITELFNALKIFVKGFAVLQDLSDHLDYYFVQSLLEMQVVKDEKEALHFLESISLITIKPTFFLK